MSQAQDTMRTRRFGVFNHFLFGNPSDSVAQVREDPVAYWNAYVDGFDVEAVAKRLHDVGAGYYFITVMQGTRYLLAPNATYDRLAGTKPGEACARRDLVADLHEALSRYDIDLFLYFTGDGPHLDPELGPRFGFTAPRKNISEAFVERWASVLEEYAVRYGDRVKGWWIDGCYEKDFGYTQDMLQRYFDACRKGNPETLVGMNNGVFPDIRKYFRSETLTCGEFNDFTVIPPSRFIDGAQTHILAPLGLGDGKSEWTRWRSKGVRRDGPYMLDYVRRAQAAGMPVTIDVWVGEHGDWDPEQTEVLRYLGNNL